MGHTDDKASEGARGGSTRARRNFQVIGAPFIKKDARVLVTGKLVFIDDLALKECLVVKVLKSPYAHAMVREIDCDVTAKIPGVECILAWKDAPQSRFTIVGRTYPEPSLYDQLILDHRLCFMGNAVVIVAGKNKAAVDHAIHLIRVEYEVLGPVLGMHDVKDSNVLIHPKEDWESLYDVGTDNRRNLCASGIEDHGGLGQALAGYTHVIKRVYHTKIDQQAVVETFRTFTHMDVYGRSSVVASTQIPFHTGRILAHALDMPKSGIHIIRPRIGGGFGTEQTVVMEVYPAIVAWKTGEPARIIYSRCESRIASSPRHRMGVRVKLGCDDSGILKAVDIYTLSNTGTYGGHGPTTVGLSDHKSIPLCHTSEVFRFSYDMVYTNRTSVGVYRGYGATQGVFAVESAISELAAELGIDPMKLGEFNMVKEGDVMPAYYGGTADNYALDRCVARVKDVMGWDGRYPRRQVNESKVRGAGLAIAMQGSSISGVDVAGVTVKINDGGFYGLIIGVADMGTGCDTTLVQAAAECLDCELDGIAVFGADTDISPYDSGSYASSTAYLTRIAVVKACEALKGKIPHKAAKYLETGVEELKFDRKRVYKLACGEDGTKKEISIKDLANRVQCANENALQVIQSHSSLIFPPPFMAEAAKTEVDLETGQMELVKLAAAVDCGTPLDENLARVQTEGGLIQGIGMALYEDINYSRDGKVHESSFIQHKVPNRLGVDRVQVEFESSFEPTGPFGAKSIGEVVINTPSPAIANAVCNAAGVRIQGLSITTEKVFRGMNRLN